MTTVLITGAAGFIGGRLANHFGKQGWRVIVDVTSEHGAKKTSRANLTASALLAAAAGVVPDIIVHGAGSGTVARVGADPANELPANLAAMLAVLEFARLRAPKARVVLLSSAAMYGSAPDAPQLEDDARAPVSLYGVVKWQAEQLCAFYSQQYGLVSSAVRLFSVYGPGLRKQLLWDAMTKFSVARSEFFGTGRECRDWIHIDDVCRFMDCLLRQPAKVAFEAFNCGGEAATTAEVLSHLAKQVGAQPPSFNGETRAGDPVCLLADCSKAERLLGWQAEIGWKTGIAEYARWFAAEARNSTEATVRVPGSQA